MWFPTPADGPGSRRHGPVPCGAGTGRRFSEPPGAAHRAVCRRRRAGPAGVGAGGIVAAQNVARMAPDGYNLLMGASSHMVQKAMQPSVKFDPQKDFAP